ncbi:L-type lectin-domain containing protein [Companilactobacillus sp. HBUAS59699]|uniref:L-type lectin-domain containing protein n=1 Tax=Companilactobacillus sp. HBUAS59699 TaxID=3109358 RepID=UPI002FEF5F09
MVMYKSLRVIILTLFVFLFALITAQTTLAAKKPPSNNNNNQNIELPVDTMPGDPDDLHHALETAPRGMDILERSFVQGKFYKSQDVDKKYNLNASKVIHRNPDSDDRTGILRVTHGKNQLGSIWGNVEGNNYFDVTKFQTMSMWVYFGHPQDPADDKTVGDGMALVFQNDDRGADAISTYNGNPAYGETLGVWGADFNNKVIVSSKEIAQTAIQKSFAIEFDTYLNVRKNFDQLNGEGVSFDINNPNSKHIAVNYPGSPKSYEPGVAPSGVKRKQYFKLNHKYGMEFMKMTDSNWHHITIQWNPKQQTLSMKYDDKNLDGTKKATQYVWNEIRVDLNKFELNGSNKLRWGFTGSTGGRFENNLIVFESIPSYVNADLDISIRNNSKNKMISEQDNRVEVGDDLTFIYNLNYKEGSKNWEQILADIDIPENVVLNSATVTYKGDEKNPEAISIDSVENNKLKFNLSRALSENVPQATIELHAKAAKVDRSTTVLSAHARFESDNLIVDEDTPSFKIDVPSLIMSINPSGIIEFNSLKNVPDVMEFHGEISLASGQKFNSKNITVYYDVNGNPSAIPLGNSYVSRAKFVLYVEREKLHVGQNVITVSAKDGRFNRTKEFEIIINIGGGLEFGTVHSEVSFVPIMAGLDKQFIQRQEGWKIEVVDSRDMGQSWQLQARAEKMISSNNDILEGDIVYKDDNGIAKELHEYTTIFSHVKSSENVQTIDVASTWENDNGILLRLNGGSSSAGRYTGKIHWCLVDSM